MVLDLATAMDRLAETKRHKSTEKNGVGILVVYQHELLAEKNVLQINFLWKF